MGVFFHLEQELCLDPPDPLVLPGPPLAEQRINLVNEYDGGLEVPENNGNTGGQSVNFNLFYGICNLLVPTFSQENRTSRIPGYIIQCEGTWQQQRAL